ncbi:DUF5710 domain-containing protein [Chitinophaga nivalis]|uniref:DUF5710 domain-containing protein n=1 Tax=Chitinophaga nivalis TaxID=2991709 RepID=A0ABT3IE99_9BACT|nr:DUF5710 domain-containing protein [Chitinophaga nivalis]MCW3468025.1 DUF5710 domain-containing protein [Chitinophaga nivalis]MCW3482284.1 DUF5710 domain-containing protein [Chitinophaga nivalis]
MSLQLNVPFAEKDAAKSKGAMWDPATKIWYLPEDRYERLPEVEQWIPAPNTPIILPTELTVAQADRPCWKCQHPNQVIAVGSYYFYEKDINERDETVWLEQSFFTLFQQVSALSDNLQHFLKDHYPHYRYGYSHTTQTSYWCNHCVSCQSIQGDWFLFDEADSVFNPTSPAAAAHILLKKFQFKYAPLIDAGYSYGDHLRLITEFATQNTTT